MIGTAAISLRVFSSLQSEIIYVGRLLNSENFARFSQVDTYTGNFYVLKDLFYTNIASDIHADGKYYRSLGQDSQSGCIEVGSQMLLVV